MISSFLDDFLILARSFQEAVEHATHTIDLLQRLGFEINWKKSSLAPSKRLEYLGIIIDLEAMTFSLPQEKIAKILLLCESATRSSQRRVELEALVGFLNFAAEFLPLGKLWLKPVIDWVNCHSSPLERKELVEVDEDLRLVLIPWSNPQIPGGISPYPAPSPLGYSYDRRVNGWLVGCPSARSGCCISLRSDNRTTLLYIRK